MGFMDKEIHVGEYMNEKQLKHLVKSAREGKGDLNTVEIVEASSADELLLDWLINSWLFFAEGI